MPKTRKKKKQKQGKNIFSLPVKTKQTINNRDDTLKITSQSLSQQRKGDTNPPECDTGNGHHSLALTHPMSSRSLLLILVIVNTTAAPALYIVGQLYFCSLCSSLKYTDS